MNPLRLLPCAVAALALTTGSASRVATQARGDGIKMAADDGEGAKYWARWRGPSGQGLANGTGYPDTWSATQNVAWKVPVPGSGNSSPIVWGDRIFMTTA